MITLAPEGSNIKTEVQFANGQITAPLAFSGSYNLLGNCMQFKVGRRRPSTCVSTKVARLSSDK